MRTTLTELALAALFTSVGLSQTPAAAGPDRTFYLTNLTSKQDLTAMATALRTVTTLREIQTDEQRSALTVSGAADIVVAADWVVHQLDLPAGAPTVSPDYKIGGPTNEVIRILRVNNPVTPATLTGYVTAVRTVADVQRMMPMEGPHAIVLRATSDKVDLAEWLFRELLPPDGKTLSGNSSSYPAQDGPNAEAQIVRVFRLNPASTNETLTATITAIRIAADIGRLFPMSTGMAIVGRASAEQMAVAEWLIAQVNATSHPTNMAETMVQPVPRNARQDDNVVRIFYVHGSSTEVSDLATEIRKTAGVTGIMPLSVPAALVLRGRADQMSTAQLIVDRFSSSRGGDAQLR